MESISTETLSTGLLAPIPDGHDEIDTALSRSPRESTASCDLNIPAAISYDCRTLPARTCSQPSETDVPTMLFDARVFAVDHLESHVEVAKSLRFIPAFSVEMSNWFPIICKSVILLLARKLLVSQWVLSAIVIADWLLLTL